MFTIHGAFCPEISQRNAFLLSPLPTPRDNQLHLGDSRASLNQLPQLIVAGMGKRIVSPLKTIIRIYRLSGCN